MIRTGNYGFTDPLFRDRTKSIPTLSIVQQLHIFMCAVRSEQDDEIKSFLPKIVRDKRHNGGIHWKKMRGIIPFNETFLRFSWHEESCGASAPMVDERYPLANTIVHSIMSSPIKPLTAFPMSVWSDEFQKACINGTAGRLSDRCDLSRCLSK